MHVQLAYFGGTFSMKDELATKIINFNFDK